MKILINTEKNEDFPDIKIITHNDEEIELLRLLCINPYGWYTVDSKGKEKGLHLLLQRKELQITVDE